MSPLLFHSFELEIAVYDVASGSLHLLSSLGADLLKSMKQNLEMRVLVNKVFIYNNLKIEKATEHDIEEAKILVKQFVNTYRELGLLD